MSNSWPTVALAELCDRLTVGHVGPMRDEYRDEGIPFLRSLNIAPFRINQQDLKLVGRDFHDKLKKSALQPGDVVIVRTGYPGTAAVIPEHLPVANCADLVVVTPGPHLVGGYLAAYLNSPLGKGVVKGRLVGVAQQHFNVTIAKQLPLPLPPVLVQERIVSVLMAYQELIENNLRRIEILEEMAQAVFTHWFVRRVEPDWRKDWSRAQLGDLLQHVRRSTTAGEHLAGLPYVPIDCITSRSVTLRDAKPWQEARSSLFLFEANDILFGAMRPYFHKVALAPRQGVTRSTCLVLRPKDNKYLHYALMVLFQEATISYATNHARGTTIPYAAWDGSLAEMPVLIPPAEVAQQFGESISAMLQLSQVLTQQNANLGATRDLLLPKVISGEIDVSDLDIDTSWLAA